MEELKKIKVAQIRGNGLTDREIKTWEYLPKDIQQIIFATEKSIARYSPISIPVFKLLSSSDNFLLKNFFKYFFGQYQRMFGLEKKLASFDIVHTCEIFNYYTFQAVRAKRFNKELKVVVTIWENSFARFEYNYWPGFSSPPRYWREKLNNIIKQNIMGVDKFLPSTNDAAELLFDLGVPKNKVQVITPAIINVKIDINNENILPEKYKNRDIYLVVNRLVKEKGVYDVLSAWKIYLNKTDESSRKVLVIVGDGPERRNILRIINDWGMNEMVYYIPYLNYTEVLSIYKKAKCLVLGSIPKSDWQEQFGYVLAESICSGTPVISTFCGAIPEVVGKAGIIVPPAHPVALAKAMLEIEDVSRYKVLKENCIEEAKKFSVDKFANDLAGIYRSLLD